eukprot:1459905-Rhodomonas_salina.1
MSWGRRLWSLGGWGFEMLGLGVPSCRVQGLGLEGMRVPCSTKCAHRGTDQRRRVRICYGPLQY